MEIFSNTYWHVDDFVYKFRPATNVVWRISTVVHFYWLIDKSLLHKGEVNEWVTEKALPFNVKLYNGFVLVPPFKER